MFLQKRLCFWMCGACPKCSNIFLPSFNKPNKSELAPHLHGNFKEENIAILSPVVGVSLKMEQIAVEFRMVTTPNWGLFLCFFLCGCFW